MPHLTRRTGLLALAFAVPVVLLVTTATAAVLDSGDSAAAPQPRTSGSSQSDPSPMATAPPAGPALLLPNLRSLPAQDVFISREGGARLLRFAGILGNLGAGPLHVVPVKGSGCPDGQRVARQVTFVDHDLDGRFDRAADRRTTSRRAGCILDHPTHDHWHFDVSASYSLSRPGAPRPIVAQDKVSFCLRDNLRTDDRVPGTPRQYYGDCGRNDRQGISVGWVDVYESDLPSQFLELPEGLRGGVYCLRTAADPKSLLEETREDDNASVRALRIRGDDVSPAPRRICAGQL